ncbi:MAG: type II secretion system protein G [Candidatus Dactylopiibacterium carminicum]|uniref:Prepilin-type N-terminal cleavage/methylation domain-containing protein n=1 Tax=Candidatus Dactylopiibacterium carminicum TaxID=857335 RepID=A0A272ER74_9RHOO|nr:prepilin-type N-terminal cleavage/methylation domain-containing protein [Candidatus Dactylopiibacterium carminicum]KAF7598774.1 prepilin-type N-terminal cleavage/methylation domain-containing protein [Candidatus Dactylopiibacterium carminicum]PAS92598.1 MAG: type II secretion system protein G [Candidatus Dactylopiibacterium carminicum]PAS93895.1 MAG: type II secretion system protein G [Candidatus Dactylopiibacterium carminicum]PAS98795.1 MAG: type II secretion system protein G [Candidatus Da
MRIESSRHGAPHRWRGFTLIEMIVAMAILALLLTIALPRYFDGLERSKEAVLAENLKITRDVIDKFYGDNGRYPESLGELVEKRYLRSLPHDPITQSNRTWRLIPPEPPHRGQIFDIRSGARGRAKDGRAYASF